MIININFNRWEFGLLIGYNPDFMEWFSLSIGPLGIHILRFKYWNKEWMDKSV